MEPPPPIRALRRVDRRGTAPPCPSCFSFVGVNLRNFFAGDSLEFFADGVGREPGGEEAAIQTGDLLIRDFAARELEFAFDAVANRKPLRLIVGRGFDGSSDVGVGDAAGAEVARNAEFPLAADFGALAGELLSIASVVELAVFFHTGHDDLREKFVGGAAVEQALHFFDGVRAAHEGAQSDIV